MHRPGSSSTNRRGFLATTVSATAALLAAPAVVTADKSGRRVRVGSGEFLYECHHDWARLPSDFSWQTTHNIAVDSQGLVYVIHEGYADKPDHPSIFVFDDQGAYVRSFGQQFQGGGHGLEVRQESGTDYLYVCAYQHLKTFAKLNTRGEVVWQQFAPMESGRYAEGEAAHPTGEWGRNRFLPTNFAFLPDGDFLLADGYGAYCVHHYQSDGTWKSTFGGPGQGPGQFDLPHGIWIDDRDPATLQIVVADRLHHQLQFFSRDGQYRSSVGGFGLPANIDRRGELLVIPELYGRVSLLDRAQHVVAVLGDDSDRIRGDEARGFQIRSDPAQWQEGKFIHPHDACFDEAGNIYVAEWVATGRITKLVRLT